MPRKAKKNCPVQNRLRRAQVGVEGGGQQARLPLPFEEVPDTGATAGYKKKRKKVSLVLNGPFSAPPSAPVFHVAGRLVFGLSEKSTILALRHLCSQLKAKLERNRVGARRQLSWNF